MTAFLTIDAQDALARSPMEPAARAAGAQLQRRGCWNVAVAYGDASVERDRITRSVGFVDRSNLRKLELPDSVPAGPAGDHGPALGRAARAADGAWRCPITPSRTLVLGGDGPVPGRVLDLTSAYCALELIGPGACELLARFCAIDVRPAVLPLGGFRPGSVARTPGYLLRTREDGLLVMVGWALGEYLWEVVADAAGHLGGGPVGAEVADA